MKFDREQIVKTLECHASGKLVECERCPLDKAHLFNATCVQAMCENALALIKELTEENEKLNERLDREARCQCDLCGQIVNLRDDVKYIKADTVRKFLDKFKDWPSDDQEYIERYAKEVLEDSRYEKDT